MRLLAFTVPIVLLYACSFSGVSGIDEDEDAVEQFIVNGTRHPQIVTLTEGEMLSIGFISDEEGNNYCTGTLVSSRVVITAKHCVDNKNASDVFVF